MKLLVAWIELHQDELLADWSLAVNGEEIFKIDGNSGYFVEWATGQDLSAETLYYLSEQGGK